MTAQLSWYVRKCDQSEPLVFIEEQHDFVFTNFAKWVDKPYVE